MIMATAVKRKTAVVSDRRLVREPEIASRKTYTIEETFKMVEDILTAHYGVPIKSK
jgi:hypothetical protein